MSQSIQASVQSLYGGDVRGVCSVIGENVSAKRFNVVSVAMHRTSLSLRVSG